MDLAAASSIQSLSGTLWERCREVYQESATSAYTSTRLALEDIVEVT